ncbi:hypothetical protein ONZ43_g799 [Nemania bipapillata]|uniref:Uncharacterized protein n=1 Tax=Nemania bipapillata TaxID=110536 RepID=A0ACC2J6X3_9PEZI|nr:hypothetical protein ONZ43_g799 [Nemania bipapillata]
MSLLNRWSFPSRGFIWDKSQEGVSPGQSKFPTMHISQPGPRRRPNLRSALSTLFDKPESRCRIRDSEGGNEAANDLPLLVPRREHASAETNFRYAHSHECEDTSPIEIPFPTGSNRRKFVSKDGESGIAHPASYPGPKSAGQGTHQMTETPKIRSFSLSSTETAGKETRAGPLTLQPAVTADNGETVCSGSSSYPSEGIRTPIAACLSPEPMTARTKSYLAAYRRYGQYPSQSMDTPASMPASEEDADSTAREDMQVVPDSSLAPSNYINTISPLFTNPYQDSRIEPACSKIMDTAYQQQKSSKDSEVTDPVLENTISSQHEANITSSQPSGFRGTPGDGDGDSDGDDEDDDDDGFRAQDKDFASTDCLRLSRDTDTTIFTAVRRSSVSLSDGEDVWSTIRGVGETRLSRAASWLQLFTVSATDGSSGTLTQRMRKLKLRKWAKRACFKTKARFQLMGKPASTARRTRSKVRRRKVRHMKKRKGGKEAKKGEKYWSVSKTLDATKERVRQHKKMADEFLGSLVKRKSMQFGLLRSGKENKAGSSHKRVKSCPASIRL